MCPVRSVRGQNPAPTLPQPHTALPQPFNAAFAALTARRSGVTAGHRTPALPAPLFSLPAAAPARPRVQPHGLRRPGPPRPRLSTPHSPTSLPGRRRGSFCLSPLSHSPRTRPRPAASSSGPWRDRPRRRCLPFPPRPGGLAVKRGGSAALSRQRCEGGRCRHVGEVRGGHGGSARPGLPWLCVIPVLEQRVKKERFWRVRDKSFRRPTGNVPVQARGRQSRGCPGLREAAVVRHRQDCGLAPSWAEKYFITLGINVGPNVGSLSGTSAASHAEARYSYVLFSFVQSGEPGGDPWMVNSRIVQTSHYLYNLINKSINICWLQILSSPVC